MTTEPNTPSQERRFRDVFAVLKRRWVIVVVTILVCVGLSVLATFIIEPTYGSTLLVELEGRTRDFSSSNPYDPLNTVSMYNPTDDLPTQVEVLMSLAVFNNAIQRAGVTKVELEDDGSPHDPVVKAKQITQTNVIALTVESKNKDTARAVANELPNAYRDYVQAKMSTQLDGAIVFMKDEVAGSEKLLKASQDALTKFRLAHNITSGDQENQERLNHLIAAQSDWRGADQRLSSARQYYTATLASRASLPSKVRNSNFLSGDHDILAEKEKIADLEGQLAAKQAIFTDNSQEVRTLKDQVTKEKAFLATMPKQIDQSQYVRNPQIDIYDAKVADAKASLDGATAALASATVALDNAKKDVGTFSNVKGEYDSLSLNVVSATNNLEKARTQLQDLQVRASKAKSPITAIANPSTPQVVRPILLLDIAIGLVVGIAMAWALVRVRESSDDRIWSAEGVLDAASLPALGNVALGASRLPALITEDRSLATNDNYRIIRSSLLNTATGEAFRSIAVTSALGDEGRSETAVNLAASMAMGGHQVVLIDANFRSPALAKLMSVPEGPGLAELLRREAVARDVARSTSVEGLHVIAAGRSDATSAELLGSDTFTALIEDLKERYHFVIVDTSACLAGADGPVTAAACEASIYVVKLGTSRRSATRYCTDLLRRTRAHVLGVVTNRPGANPRSEFREFADA